MRRLKLFDRHWKDEETLQMQLRSEKKARQSACVQRENSSFFLAAGQSCSKKPAAVHLMVSFLFCHPKVDTSIGL